MWPMRIFLALCCSLGVTLNFADASTVRNYQTRSERKGHVTRYACEGETLNISCPADQVIEIVRANYGRFAVHVCNEEGIDWSNRSCQGPGTVAIMQERCENKRSCSLQVDNDNFYPDPCPNVYKYLEVQYRCGEARKTTSTPSTTTTEKLPERENPVAKETVTKSYNKPEPAESEAVTTKSAKIVGKLTTVGPDEDEQEVKAEPSKPRFCPETLARDVNWPQTELGHFTRQPCPNDRRESAEWFCSQEGFWVPEKLDMSRCVSGWARRLEWDSKHIDSSSRALEVARKLQRDTRMNPLYGGDAIVAANVMERVVIEGRNYVHRQSIEEKKRFAADLGDHLVHTGGHLLRVENSEAWEDLPLLRRIRTANSILDSLEQNGILLADSMTKKNDVESTEAPSQYIFMEVSAIPVFRTHNYIKFPSRSLWDNSMDWVQVPKSALIRPGTEDTDHARTIFVSYKNLGDYLTPTPETREMGGKVVKVERKVVSKVMTATIGQGRPLGNLREPVIITMATEKNENLTNPTCAFWDKKLGVVGEWSSRGCRVVKNNDTHTVCSCDHLTNFAILMDVRGLDFSYEHTVFLSFITYVGCVISVVCLILSIFAFCIMKGSSSDRITIHINLCFCLLIAELVFIFGIAQTKHEILCSVVAGLLHYFFLAAFSWMLLEGFQLYALLVEVFETENSRKKWFYMFGYGIPLVIVGISLAVDYESYGTAKYCWLRTDNYFVFSFVGPVIVVIAANSVLLAMAIVIMCRHSHPLGYRHCRHRNTLENTRVWIKGAVVLVFLLGLTWAFGILYINESTVVMAYLFAVLNSLQGMFIFLFHVVLNEKMRKEYRKWIRRNDWLPDCLRDPTLTEYKPASGLQKVPPNSSSRCSASSPIPNSDSTSSTGQSYLVKFLQMNKTQPRYNSSAQLLLGKPGYYNDSKYEYAYVHGESESSDGCTLSSPCSTESTSFSPHFITFPLVQRSHPHRPPPNFPPPNPPYLDLLPDLTETPTYFDSQGKRPVSQKSSCTSTTDSAFSDGSSFRSAGGHPKVVVRRMGSKEEGVDEGSESAADFIVRDLAENNYPSASDLNSLQDPKPEIPVCYKSAPNLKKAAAMNLPSLLKEERAECENPSLLSLPDLSYEVPKTTAMRFSPNLLSPLPSPGEQNVYASAQSVRPKDSSKKSNFRASCK